VLAVQRGTVIRSVLRMAWASALVITVVAATATIVAPKLIEALGQVVGSLNVTSEVGQSKKGGGALRVAEWQNMFLNLGDHVTPAWVFGRGVGTYWQEFVPTDLALDAGSAAFVEAQLEAGAQGWWPSFHLPFVTAVYRFGLLGMTAIWLFTISWLLRWRTFIRGLTGVERAFAVMVVVLVFGMLLSMGETFDSAGPSLFGILLACLVALRPAPVPTGPAAPA